MRFCTKSMMNMMAQRCLLVQPYAIQILSNVPEISSLTLRFCLKTLRFCNGTLVSAVFCSGASVAPELCLSSVLPPVSLKCPEISSLTMRFCTQKHDGHDGSKMPTCTTLCRPVSLKCPEISSLTLRFCTKHMMDMMAQRRLLVQLSVVQFLSNVPR